MALNDAQIKAGFEHLHLKWVDPEQTTLQGDASTVTLIDEVNSFLDSMGVNTVTLIVPDRIYDFKRSQYGNHSLNIESRGNEEVDFGLLVAEPDDDAPEAEEALVLQIAEEAEESGAAGAIV